MTDQSEAGFAFDFYDIAAVVNGVRRRDRGREVVVLGRARDDDGTHRYAVAFDNMSEPFMVDESDLTPTGKQAKRADFVTGHVLHVGQDGQILGRSFHPEQAG